VIESYRDLDVWQHAMILVEQVYAISKTFPADERFGLTAQLRRAAVSIPSCIAEGNVRHTTRDYLRFVAIAAGSTAEVETQLLLAERLGMVAPADAKDVLLQCDRVGRMLNRLRQSLDNKLGAAKEA
jgi:four helix bundle protein